MKKIALMTILFLSVLVTACSSKFDKYMDDGKESLRNKDYANALSSFNDALIEKPNDKDALALLDRVKSEELHSKREIYLSSANKLYEEVMDISSNLNKQADNVSATDALSIISKLDPLVQEIKDLNTEWEDDELASKSVSSLNEAVNSLNSAFVSISEDIHEPLVYDESSYLSKRRAQLSSNDSTVRALIEMVDFKDYIETFEIEIEKLKLKL